MSRTGVRCRVGPGDGSAEVGRLMRIATRLVLLPAVAAVVGGAAITGIAVGDAPPTPPGALDALPAKLTPDQLARAASGGSVIAPPPSLPGATLVGVELVRADGTTTAVPGG